MKLVHCLVAVCLLSAPAYAGGHKGHGSHTGEGAMAAYMQPMDAMMKAMEKTSSSNDADIDFLVMMIPHHQAAVDMAKVQLKLGKDPQTRALSEAIIKTQEKEIADMTAMIARLKAAKATR